MLQPDPVPLLVDPSMTQTACIEPIEPNDSCTGKASKSQRLVAFVKAHAELFHDANREAYARIHHSGQTFRLGSFLFRDWLSASALEELDMVVSDQARREAIDALSGYARFKGEEYPVFLRVGCESGRYVIDLGQLDNACAVVVEPGRWYLTDQPPVRFVRSPDFHPLPQPDVAGHIEPLWQVANIPTRQRPLVLAWLLDCFRPDTPYPVLELIGEEGTAKSTTHDALRQLIDPNYVNLRAAPKNREDLCTAAAANHLVSYENLSHLSGEMQDALCTVSTGGGFSSRKLYAQGEETTLKFKRPAIINGIAALITQQDLLSRALSIELPRLIESREEAEVRAYFAQHKAGIFGGLLNLFAKALALLPDIDRRGIKLPRMGDYCLLGMAMTQAQDQDPLLFHALYGECTREGIHRTIDASPVASAILALIERNPAGIIKPVNRILEDLKQYRPEACDAWPKTSKGLADSLRRLSPALGKIGIEVRKRDDLSRRDGMQWQIGKLRFSGSPPSPPSPPSPTVSWPAIGREGGEHGEGDCHDSQRPQTSGEWEVVL